MPNWCFNRVQVSGAKDVLAAFVDAVEGDEDAFSFERVCPTPPPLVEIVSGLNRINGVVCHRWRQAGSREVACSPEELAALEKAHGATDAMEWRRRHWGCKWDASEVEIEGDPTLGYVQYTFETPWGPPEPVCHALRERFPELDLVWFYDEPNMQAAGYL